MSVFTFESKDDVIAAAMDFVEERATYTSASLSDPRMVKDMLRLRLGDREREVFCVLYLNARHGLIEVEELFLGTIDGAAVYPREVVKAALRHNSCAVILGHNHPSGYTEPSSADKRVTERIKNALELIDIRVLDHVIVSGSDFFQLC